MSEHFTAGQQRALTQKNTNVGIAMIGITVFVGFMWFTMAGSMNLFLRLLGLVLALGSIAAAAIPPQKLMNRDATLFRFGGRIAQVWVMWLVGTGFVPSSHSGSKGLLSLLNFVWAIAMTVGLLQRRRAVKDLPQAMFGDSVAAQREREKAYEDSILRDKNRLNQPTTSGRMTGFEPAILEGWQLRQPALMHGVPGAGLSGSGFATAAVAKGQLGELNFAKALDRAGVLEKVASFWSVQMPSEDLGAHESFKTDIDCVIVTGTTVYLLDMKNYTQGDVTWVQSGEQEIRMIDNPTGNDIGMPRKMSKNMKMAQDVVKARMARLGLTQRIESRVVFMPTEQGMGTIDQNLRWPGDVPAVSLEQFLAEVSTQPAFNSQSPDAEYVLRLFRVLVKDESGSAARPGVARASTTFTRTSSPTSGVTTAPVSTPRAASTPPAAAAPTPAPEPAPPATPQCKECHEPLEPNAQFCFKCGAPA